MAKIVGIGANVFDTLYRIPTYPTEDTKLRAISSKTAGGGPVATGLVAAARLGAEAAWIGVLADDNGGRFLKADFEKYGVATDLITVLPGYRSFASVLWLCQDKATRTCVFDRGDLPPLAINNAQKQAVAEADLLMVDGNELEAAVEAAKLAQSKGVKVLYDCGGLYPHVERLLAHTDLMIPSEEFALGHTGCQTPEASARKLFETYCPELVVITQGKAGGILFDGKTLTRYPAFAVEAVDTNGAGDVFHGAFAAAVTLGYSYDRCCLVASAVSAIKCTGIGARESTPTLAQALAFLAQQGFAL